MDDLLRRQVTSALNFCAKVEDEELSTTPMLKRHQWRALEWMFDERERKGGGLLCHEMGMGKTRIVTSYILARLLDRPHLCDFRKFLVVVPRIVFEQWIGELTAVGLEVYSFYGTSRLIGPVTLTTYGTLQHALTKKGSGLFVDALATSQCGGDVTDHSACPQKWTDIFFDEGHYLRNSRTAAYAAAEKLHATRKWIITGTPFVNSHRDILSLVSLAAGSNVLNIPPKEVRQIFLTYSLRETMESVTTANVSTAVAASSDAPTNVSTAVAASSDAPTNVSTAVAASSDAPTNEAAAIVSSVPLISDSDMSIPPITIHRIVVQPKTESPLHRGLLAMIEGPSAYKRQLKAERARERERKRAEKKRKREEEQKKKKKKKKTTTTAKKAKCEPQPPRRKRHWVVDDDDDDDDDEENTDTEQPSEAVPEPVPDPEIPSPQSGVLPDDFLCNLPSEWQTQTEMVRRSFDLPNNLLLMNYAQMATGMPFLVSKKYRDPVDTDIVFATTTAASSRTTEEDINRDDDDDNLVDSDDETPVDTGEDLPEYVRDQYQEEEGFVDEVLPDAIDRYRILLAAQEAGATIRPFIRPKNSQNTFEDASFRVTYEEWHACKVQVQQALETKEKMERIVADIESRRDNGARKLIFTKFRAQTQYLFDVFREKEWSVRFIDGNVSKGLRSAILNNPNPPEVLIVNIGCASCGINLVGYSEVYFACMSWNQSEEDQAIKRVHRLGQTQPVHIYKYVLANSFDERMELTQVRKQSTSATIVSK